MFTLAIPTYNRKETIYNNIVSIINQKLNHEFKITIIDNNSSDGTYELLSNEFRCQSNIEILKNEKNIGIRGNYCRLIENCQTKYIVITSDEDYFIKDGLNKLNNNDNDILE